MRRVLTAAVGARALSATATKTAAAAAPLNARRQATSSSQAGPVPPTQSSPSPPQSVDTTGAVGGGVGVGVEPPGRRPVRTLFPRARLRADAERPPARRAASLAGRPPHLRDFSSTLAEFELAESAEPATHTPFFEAGGGVGVGGSQQQQHQQQQLLRRKTAAPTATDTLEAPGDDEQQYHGHHASSNNHTVATASATVSATASVSLDTPAAATALAVGEAPGLNEVQSFLEAVQQQVDQARFERNETIPYPAGPDASVPLFRRMKRHTKMQVTAAAAIEDPDYPTFPRLDAFVALPPAGKHPWVKNTPIGHVVHGDGQLGVVGSGEVGFENAGLRGQGGAATTTTTTTTSGAFVEPGNNTNTNDNDDGNDDVDEATLRQRRRGWRGLQHQSVLQRQLPQRNGKVLQDAVVRHSFSLTGRGLFATRDVKRGETIMIVESTGQSLGVKGEIRRLEDMVADVIIATHEACFPDAYAAATDGNGNGNGASVAAAADTTAHGTATAHGEKMKSFLHDWILTGQPSSLVEHWPTASTRRVLDRIGGRAVLDSLELHTIHVARLAAIIDLNSFLVESSYAERKGMAYFPEAGFLNHSCVPNATYDIMPVHTFRESDYYLDEAVEAEFGNIDDDNDISNGNSNGDASANHGGDGSGGGNGGRPVADDAAAAEDDTPGNHLTTTPTSAAAAAVSHRGFDYLAAPELPDLTDAGAPRYLFCCRAELDLKAGDEILISYIPPSWSFDNRQYVLHDRYKFWCKCPKCAPVLEEKYARVPRLMVIAILFSIVLQILVLYQRDSKNTVDGELERLRAMTEDERIDELRARGIDIGDMSVDAKVRSAERRQRQGSLGLFEMLDRQRQREAYEHDGVRGGTDPVMDKHNPYPSVPRGL